MSGLKIWKKVFCPKLIMKEIDEPKSGFEGEMTRLMKVAIGGIEDLKQEVKNANQKIDVLTAQFSDMASMVI